MSEQDTSSDPQNDSTSGTPSNQANSTPATESKKSNNQTAKTSKKKGEKEKIRKAEKGENTEKEELNIFQKGIHRFKNRMHRINIFKNGLHEINKYITEDNPNLDINEINKKYPIDTLASIFKLQKKDLKIIVPTSILLLAHTIFYYLKLTHPIEIFQIVIDDLLRIVIVDLLRITITTMLLIFATKNVCSAYQNRLIIVESFKKYPLQFFTTIIAAGGLFALTVPAVMNVLKLIGDSSALTTAILTITGGFIAVFGLIKSHQKSELEREQLEVQKQKDVRDHIRQLHASYNDRFDKAVAELNSNDLKSAYAAVPKLATLADAWLDYKDLSNNEQELEKLKNKAMKEAQTIINVLCKYIRTIPNNYTHEQLKEFKSLPESDLPESDIEKSLPKSDIEKLTHEADIRRLIFSEMSKRSSTFIKKQNLFIGLNSIVFKERGPWSDFDFDFSHAPIFYHLNNLTIESGKFTNARFYGTANFVNTIFVQDAYFDGTKFTKNALFSNASFMGQSFFNFSNFAENAHFGAVNFKKLVNFSTATFNQKANFRDATFSEKAWFVMTTFLHDAIFFCAAFEKYEPTFAGVKLHARFSIHAEQQIYHFLVRGNSKPLHTDIARLDGIKRCIPVGTTLFYPKSPGDKNGNYRESAPAGQLFKPMIPLKFSHKK